jgi:hypothetical protein
MALGAFEDSLIAEENIRAFVAYLKFQVMPIVVVYQKWSLIYGSLAA